jgi:Divergent InlB B-repeat domain
MRNVAGITVGEEYLMRLFRVLSSTFAILLLAIAILLGASVGAANPQQSTSPQSKSDGVAAPDKKASGWDPDWGPRKVRPQQAPPVFTGPYAPGEVFVSDETGLVDVFKPDGTFLGSLNTGQTLSAGMAFDQSGKLYVTTFGGLSNTPPVGVVEFDIDGNLIGPFGNFPSSVDGTALPESILFNRAGDAIVGAATDNYVCPDATSGPVPAFEFDPNGNLLNTFTVTGQCRGTDWVELLPDQITLLYTSEGTSVLSFNTSTLTQNPDLADNLPGAAAFAFRVLPNGNLLVADSTVVVQLSPSGQQIMTYTPNPSVDELFALNLDPDGTSFWTADLATGNIFRFTIADGTQLINFVTPDAGASGLAVFGEKLVGTNNLTVTDMGTGTGTVTSTPSGISCPSVCLAPFSDNTNVTLTATAAEGSTFAGFSSNCVPANPQTNPPTCTVPIGTADVTVTATFNTGSSDTLTVMFAGTGSGAVSSSPAGINACSTTCSANFSSGAQVTLTASPADGSTFAGWSGGGCSGTGTCVVTLNAATTVTATFNSSTSGLALRVTEAGSGTGTVTSAPAGISCPTTCSANFASGTQVTLTASAASGSTFAGWSGGGCTGTGTCMVTLTAATAVTSTFNSGSSPVTIGIGQGSSSTVTTTPGSSAVFGLVLTALPGTTGTVQLTCSSPVKSITCNIVPSSITLTGKAINVAIVVETFCKGSLPKFVPTPGALGTGLGLLLATLCLCGLAWTYKKQPRWAVSFGLLIIFAVGMSACSSVAKSPSGSATPPGNYALVVTATAPNGATSSVPLTLKVQ